MPPFPRLTCAKFCKLSLKKRSHGIMRCIYIEDGNCIMMARETRQCLSFVSSFPRSKEGKKRDPGNEVVITQLQEPALI